MTPDALLDYLFYSNVPDLYVAQQLYLLADLTGGSSEGTAEADSD